MKNTEHAYELKEKSLHRWGKRGKDIGERGNVMKEQGSWERDESKMVFQEEQPWTGRTESISLR